MSVENIGAQFRDYRYGQGNEVSSLKRVLAAFFSPQLPALPAPKEYKKMLRLPAPITQIHESPQITKAQKSSTVEVSPLSQQELYQLTLYKWRYSLEAYGFSPPEVRDLMFVKWLFTSRRVLP